jgi:hypothetical protein
LIKRRQMAGVFTYSMYIDIMSGLLFDNTRREGKCAADILDRSHAFADLHARVDNAPCARTRDARGTFMNAITLTPNSEAERAITGHDIRVTKTISQQ